MGGTEIAPDTFLQGDTLFDTDNGYRHIVNPGNACNNSRIIAKAAVSMKLQEVLGKAGNKTLAGRPVFGSCSQHAGVGLHLVRVRLHDFFHALLYGCVALFHAFVAFFYTA